MKDKDILIEKFIEFEKRYDLFSLEINNIKIWDFVRFEIYSEIKKQKNNFIETKKSIRSNIIQNIFPILGQILKIFFSIFKYKIKFDKEILFIGHSRRKYNSGSFIDIYSDPIIELINEKYEVDFYEYPDNFSHHTPTKYKVGYLDVLELMTSFYTLGANYFINNQDFDKINKLTELINQNFVESVNIKSIILRNLKKYKFSCNRLNSLLDGSKIKLIILVESYNFINKVLISVAHKKNIYVCELQHGSIGTSHIAYNYAYGQNINSLPDEIFLWGKYWANRIRIPSKLSVTGFPYIENHSFNIHHSKINKNILVVSQWTIGYKLILEINRIASKLPKYNFYFKLHPLEYKNYNNYLSLSLQKNIIVIKDEYDSYELFKKCSTQIGVYSTLLVEGIAFGLKTFIIPIQGYEFYLDLINKKYIEILDDYKKINFKNNKINHAENINYFWQNNSSKNILARIQKLMK